MSVINKELLKIKNKMVDNSIARDKKSIHRKMELQIYLSYMKKMFKLLKNKINANQDSIFHLADYQNYKKFLTW